MSPASSNHNWASPLSKRGINTSSNTCRRMIGSYLGRTRWLLFAHRTWSAGLRSAPPLANQKMILTYLALMGRSEPTKRVKEFLGSRPGKKSSSWCQRDEDWRAAAASDGLMAQRHKWRFGMKISHRWFINSITAIKQTKPTYNPARTLPFCYSFPTIGNRLVNQQTAAIDL